jgi:hypothetical protein
MSAAVSVRRGCHGGPTSQRPSRHTATKFSAGRATPTRAVSSKRPGPVRVPHFIALEHTTVHPQQDAGLATVVTTGHFLSLQVPYSGTASCTAEADAQRCPEHGHRTAWRDPGERWTAALSGRSPRLLRYPIAPTREAIGIPANSSSGAVLAWRRETCRVSHRHRCALASAWFVVPHSKGPTRSAAH